MIYTLSVLFILAFVLYSKYQFMDDKLEKNTGKWHPYGALMRLLFVAAVVNSWQDFLIMGIMVSILWDMLINKIALKRPLFYVGTTSWWDLKLGKYKWDLYLITLLIAIGVKIFIYQ